jgi:1-deoxyxylulose-5-phosphate synthase
VGTATFGVAPTERDADRVVHSALDLGINFVDTADVYGILSTFDRPRTRRLGRTPRGI